MSKKIRLSFDWGRGSRIISDEKVHNIHSNEKTTNYGWWRTNKKTLMYPTRKLFNFQVTLEKINVKEILVGHAFDFIYMLLLLFVIIIITLSQPIASPYLRSQFKQKSQPVYIPISPHNSHWTHFPEATNCYETFLKLLQPEMTSIWAGAEKNLKFILNLAEKIILSKNLSWLRSLCVPDLIHFTTGVCICFHSLFPMFLNPFVINAMKFAKTIWEMCRIF